jgi:hypothetical protein
MQYNKYNQNANTNTKIMVIQKSDITSTLPPKKMKRDAWWIKNGEQVSGMERDAICGLAAQSKATVASTAGQPSAK